MSKAMHMSSQGGGHLYMQTNEICNATVHYRWSKSGTLTEVERAPTGGAGSGTFKPISGQESAPNAFEGTGSVVLRPVSSPCDGRHGPKLQSAAAEIGRTSSKVRVLAGDISSPATGAALLESAKPPRSVGVPSAIDMYSKDARVNGETEQRLCAFSAWRETLQRRW